MPENFNQTPPEFKPNIYPVIYWALAYGAIAGLVLFLVNLLSQYITVIWFPVFLAGLTWGGYRNYKKQKSSWSHNNGVALTPQSPLNEFKQAAQDIIGASREMMSEQQAEDAYQAQVAEEQARQEAMQSEVEEEPPQYAPTPENSPDAQPEYKTPPNVPPSIPPREQPSAESDENTPPPRV